MYQARRGDELEAYLKAFRNNYQHGDPRWHAIDALIDDYRLHADTGTPLSGVVNDQPHDEASTAEPKWTKPPQSDAWFGDGECGGSRPRGDVHD